MNNIKTALLASLIALIVFGVGFAPNIYGINTSITKNNPKYDEVKTKLNVKAQAIEEKRKADLMMKKQLEENNEILRKNKSKATVSESILLQYRMFDDAKTMQSQLSKIQIKHMKENLKKQTDMEKLVNSGQVKLHTKYKNTTDTRTTK